MAAHRKIWTSAKLSRSSYREGVASRVGAIGTVVVPVVVITVMTPMIVVPVVVITAMTMMTAMIAVLIVVMFRGSRRLIVVFAHFIVVIIVRHVTIG
jgi:hypothetical protein